MAFKPSMRSTNRVKEIPLDIRPVMNLMVVLIPILLYSAEFVKLSIRELNLPPASTANSGGAQEKPQEEAKRLQLTVIVAREGFYIGNKSGYLTGETDADTNEPSVPLDETGNYDYVALQEQLKEFKTKIEGQEFVDENSIIISAGANIEYRHIIKTIDFVTMYENERGDQFELFPQVNIGQII